MDIAQLATVSAGGAFTLAGTGVGVWAARSTARAQVAAAQTIAREQIQAGRERDWIERRQNVYAEYLSAFDQVRLGQRGRSKPQIPQWQELFSAGSLLLLLAGTETREAARLLTLAVTAGDDETPTGPSAETGRKLSQQRQVLLQAMRIELGVEGSGSRATVAPRPGR